MVMPKIEEPLPQPVSESEGPTLVVENNEDDARKRAEE
jgi:hypothetical protein